MFDTIAELNAAKGTFGFVVFDVSGSVVDWGEDFGEEVGGMIGCAGEGEDDFDVTASDGGGGLLEVVFAVFGVVEIGVFFVAFGFAGACAAACVDSSRTCSSIFDVFGVTVDFVRTICASEGLDEVDVALGRA
jgi:hypothetical protein